MVTRLIAIVFPISRWRLRRILESSCRENFRPLLSINIADQNTSNPESKIAALFHLVVVLHTREVDAPHADHHEERTHNKLDCQEIPHVKKVSAEVKHEETIQLQLFV